MIWLLIQTNHYLKEPKLYIYTKSIWMKQEINSNTTITLNKSLIQTPYILLITLRTAANYNNLPIQLSNQLY